MHFLMVACFPCCLQDTQRHLIKKRSSLPGVNKIGVGSSQMSGVKVKTLTEIRQERKRVRADTHEVGMPKKKLTGRATAVQRDHATGQSHAQQPGAKKSEPSSPPSAVLVAPPGSMPTALSHEISALVTVPVPTTSKTTGSQCDKESLSNPPSEGTCTPSQNRTDTGSGALSDVQKQAARVKIRKPSMGPEAKPSLSPDVTAIEDIKSAIQLDR